MSVVCLTTRLASSEKEFDEAISDSEALSKVLVDPTPAAVDSGVSIDLRVGAGYYRPRDGHYYSSSGGFQVRPHQAVVIRTLEKVRLPGDILGLITGKGKHIWKGGFISPGKIDPGFEDNLCVAFYNAGRRTIEFAEGDPICVACFFEHSGTKRPRKKRTIDRPPEPRLVPWYRKYVSRVVASKETLEVLAIVLAIVLSVIALMEDSP